MTLKQRRDAYKQFFSNSEAGQEFIKDVLKLIDRNVNTAMDDNSLDYLSRSKGNREVFDLIDNVLKTEVKPKA